MPKIKNWELTQVDGAGKAFYYTNKNDEYFVVTVGMTFEKPSWFFEAAAANKRITVEMGTKKEMMKAAHEYMRRHS